MKIKNFIKVAWSHDIFKKRSLQIDKRCLIIIPQGILFIETISRRYH